MPAHHATAGWFNDNNEGRLEDRACFASMWREKQESHPWMGVAFTGGVGSNQQSFMGYKQMLGPFNDVCRKWCLQLVPEIIGLEVRHHVGLGGDIFLVKDAQLKTYSALLGLANIMYAPYRGPRTVWLYEKIKPFLPHVDNWKLFYFLTAWPSGGHFISPRTEGKVGEMLCLPTGDSGHWMSDAKGFPTIDYAKSYPDFIDELNERRGLNEKQRFMKGGGLHPDPLWTIEEFAENADYAIERIFDI